MAFAKSYFDLDMKGVDGSSKRDHLKVAANATNKVPIELQNLPELPESAAHVWGWFLELNSTRPIGMNGPAQITYAEIKSWQNLTKEELAVWEIKAIKALDRAYINRKD